MKRYILLTFCITVCTSLFGQNTGFKLNEITSYSSIEVKDKDVNFIQGFKLQSNIVNLIYQIPFNTKQLDISQSTYGLTINTTNKFIPYISILGAGNISYTGLYSIINQPSSLSFSSIIKPTLPSFSSSKKDESIFIFMDSTKQSFPDMCFFININKNWGISINWTLDNLCFGITTESIQTKKNNSSSWYTTTKFISKGYLQSIAFPFYLKGNIIEAETITGITENPYTTISFWNKSRITLSIQSFKLKNTLFLSDKNAINADGSLILTPLILSINPTYFIKLQSSSINIKSIYTLKQTIDNTTNQNVKYQQSITFEISYKKNLFSILSQTNIDILQDIDNNQYKQKLQFIYNAPLLKINSSFSYKYTKLKQNYLLSINLYPEKMLIESFCVKAEAIQKKNKNTELITSLPMQLKWEFDYINVYAKLGFFYTFYINSDD